MDRLGFTGLYGIRKIGLIATMILWVTILLALLYLGVLTIQFYKCEKKLAEETEAAEGVKYKYIGLEVLWVALALVTGILILYANRSDYSVTDWDNGFSIESKRMNTGLEREYEAKRGIRLQSGMILMTAMLRSRSRIAMVKY